MSDAYGSPLMKLFLRPGAPAVDTLQAATEDGSWTFSASQLGRVIMILMGRSIVPTFDQGAVTGPVDGSAVSR